MTSLGFDNTTENFVLHLHSTDDFGRHPDNTLSKFTTNLQTPVDLIGEWGVAAVESAFHNNIVNITDGRIIFLGYRFKRNENGDVNTNMLLGDLRMILEFKMPTPADCSSPQMYIDAFQKAQVVDPLITKVWKMSDLCTLGYNPATRKFFVQNKDTVVQTFERQTNYRHLIWPKAVGDMLGLTELPAAESKHIVQQIQYARPQESTTRYRLGPPHWPNLKVPETGSYQEKVAAMLLLGARGPVYYIPSKLYPHWASHSAPLHTLQQEAVRKDPDEGFNLFKFPNTAIMTKHNTINFTAPGLIDTTSFGEKKIPLLISRPMTSKPGDYAYLEVRNRTYKRLLPYRLYEVTIEVVDDDGEQVHFMQGSHASSVKLHFHRFT